MDLQNIFGLLRKLFADPQIFLGFAMVFWICQTFLDSDLRKYCDLKHFFGFAKYFWIVPSRLPYISYMGHRR